MMQDDGVVLVVGSGGRRYREYLLAGAARRRPLWLLDAHEPSWQTPYVEGASVVPLVDEARLIPNQEALVEAACEVAARRRVVGAFSYDETLIVSTAHIAETLGLPGLTIDGVENCRNKHRNRRRLTAAGLPQPQYVFVRSLEKARAAAEQIGYPVVLKPQGMGASIGVIRAQEADGLGGAFEVAYAASYGGNPAYEGGVLVEEMLSGPEISIDGVVFRGQYEPLILARKKVGLEPYFEEVGHVVDPDDPLLADPELRDVLCRGHEALGLQYGMTHTEVMLTPSGMVIVEVNGRLGGDLIPYLGQLATDIVPGGIAADVAAGSTPVIQRSQRRIVGIRFLYPPADCRVVEVTLPLNGAVPGLLEAAPMVDPGAELRLPPKGYIGRYAYVICTADDAERCSAALDEAAALAHLSFEEPAEEVEGLVRF